MLSLNRIGRTSATLALTVSALTLGACGSSSGTTTGSGSGGTSSSSSGATSGSGGSSTGTSTASSSGSGGSAPVCTGLGFGGGETKVAGGSVSASIVDETGAPVVGQPVYICGIDICSNPGKTDAAGKITITTNLMMKKPAFKFGDTITYAEMAIPLSAATSDFMTVATGKFPTAGATLTPGADAVSGGVTVSVPAGASVGIDSIVYDTPEKQKLRAVNIPLTHETAVLAPVTFTDGGPGFSLIYGLAPAETPVCPAAKVSVALPHDVMTPNNLGWAPKAAVEFWIMTTDTGQVYAPYAGWAKASDGVVSDDGTTVATVDGGGFIFLETFAIRLKP